MSQAPRSAKTGKTLKGKNTVTMAFDTSGLNDLLNSLGDSVNEAVRPAAQAGAQVLYEAVVQNVAGIGKVSGNLESSIYQVYSASNSSDTKATYQISWNHKKAPHGHLVEFGHIQRYQVNIGKGGKWYTVVRPGMEGKPKPRRGSSQAEKDAYWMPRPGGPIQITGRAYIRRAADKSDEALSAAKAELFKRIDGATQ